MSWTNWAGTLSAAPDRVLTPRDAGEVEQLLESAVQQGRRLRPVGSGHSFTDIAVPRQDQVCLDRLSGVVTADVHTGLVRVLGGTPLHVLGPTLWALGLALPNLGDIDRQTIAGALATGTHGTGGRLHGIAAAVTGLTIVTPARGSVRCSATQEPDLFQAARVGLGALGIVTEVELQCVPAYRLHAVERPERIDAVLERIDTEVEANRHVDLYWFPHTDRAMVKRNNLVPDDHAARPLPRWRARLDDDLLSNRVFELTCRAAAARPRLTPRINAVAARALSAREYADRSYRVFCTQRDVRFVESEYAVPRAALVPALTELRGWVERSGEHIAFPVEVRFIAADDVWLSTAYQRETAYIAVHQFHRMRREPYFEAFEAIVAAHDGRPHWGKVHTLDADRLGRLYPRFGDFRSVRDQVDPTRVLANDYLDRVLGP
ncbi:MAG: FAD-binding protein [Micrococcales bacterium]|nr:FAD-binding protein [Micrococcales bacterium]